MSLFRPAVGWLLACVVLISPAFAVNLTVSGVVRDSSGAALKAAVIDLRSGSFAVSTKTDERGEFIFPRVPVGSGTVVVAAQGFATLSRSWESSGSSLVHLEITLQPAASSERVTVSAARSEIRLSDTPGSAILLSSEDLTAAPALRIDDALRQVPGFSLFRRSGSRTANASAQGVSLRGLGGSAASRALVMADGIPLVDPFGGWVYWDRIPRMALSSVEVFRGGSSNLYGSSALGGVVQFRTLQPESPKLALEMSYGNQITPDISVWAGSKTGQWDYSLATELFRTDGYLLVPDSIRGFVDAPANSRNATVHAQVGHAIGSAGRIFARGNFFAESRKNGTLLQANDTRLGEGAIGLDQRLGSNDSLTFRLYTDVGSYNQTFSAVAADRNTETLTNLQHVPEQVVGGAVQWGHTLGKSHTLIAGADLYEVIGASNEILFTGPNQNRNGGGRQRTLGIFGEDVFRRPKWTLILGARLDHWKNFRGRLETVPLDGSPAVTNYPDRTELALSPRLSVLRTVNEHLSLTASMYRAFRAPTLNELYRTFRVGNVLTNNNASLRAERLTGAEAGLNMFGWDRRLALRGTFFWSDIVNPVANVTLSTTPTIITREKQNLGRTRSRGVELDGILRVNRTIQVSAGYAYTAATVASYPANPGGISLVGLDIPQVPRNVFTWQARYWNPSKLILSVTGRFLGRQFDDDQNRLPLDRFHSLDMEVGRTLTRHFEVFAAIENVFNQRYQVARTPVLNLGPPILVRVGLRVNYPSKEIDLATRSTLAR